MKKLSLLLLLASFSLVACTSSRNNNSDGKTDDDSGQTVNPGGDDGDKIDPTVKITVNYYLDYNQLAAKVIYYTEEVQNGSKLTKPGDPSKGNFPEFPVFKGWSTKEVIDNVSDLWDFDKDVVSVTSGKTFNLFGIWVATGE